jgi:hypothetical protein
VEDGRDPVEQCLEVDVEDVLLDVRAAVVAAEVAALRTFAVGE